MAQHLAVAGGDDLDIASLPDRRQYADGTGNPLNKQSDTESGR
jgi:hypothetical protein